MSQESYLIHFPAPTRLAYTDTWRALEKLYREGLIRAIGVSNFKFPFLDRLLRTTEIVPAVHQIEVHPTYQQAELDQLSRDHGIVVEAYSPLGRAADRAEPQIGAIAEAHGVTPAQVILRWHLQAGRVALPKSASPERIANNIDMAGFVLSDDEMAAISCLKRGLRTGEDVETFN